MARLTQQQVEQWIAQNGGAQGLQYGVEQKQIKNPDPGSPEPYVNIEVEVWKNPKTGAALTVRRGEDGDFEQIENVGPKPSADDDTPEKRQKAEEEREKQWNRDNGGLYETHAQRREREAKDRQAAEATKRQQEQDARQTRIDEQNAATQAANARRAEAAESRAVAEANRSTTTSRNVKGGDGRDYIQIVTTSPDGKTTSVRNIGPDGKDVAEIPGAPSGLAPADAPKPSGKLGEAAADLTALDAWLEPQVRSGKVTPAQADKIRESRRAYWETATKEQEAIVNAQSAARGQEITQRGQTLTDIGSRRSNATSIANQASNDWMGYADKFGSAPTSSLAAAIRASRVNAQDFVTMSGGNRNVGEVAQGPAMAAVNGMQLPGGVSMGPGFNPRPTTVGAAPVAPASAVGPVAAGVTATTTAAANPTGPNVQAATDATMAGSQAAFAGAGVPPTAPPAAPSAPPPPLTNPMQAPGPGPTIKVRDQWGNEYDMTQQQMDNRPGGSTDLTPVDQPQAMAAPPPHFLAGSSRGHAFDPTPSIRAMIADPRYDNETVRAVVAEEYPGYDVDALLQGAA